MVFDRKEYKKEWYLKNKEKIAQQNKEYYENNKEQKKEYKKTEKGIKSNRIGNWKTIGVIHDDFDALYTHYINTNECNICKCNFTDKNKKCLDHDHQTGLFRYVLCNSCNVNDNWKNKL